MDQHKNNTTNGDGPLHIPLSHPGHPDRKKILILIGSIVALLLIAGIIFVLIKKPVSEPQSNANQNNQSVNQPQSQSAFLQQYGQGCKDREAAFTSPPMKQDELAYIRPLGAVSDAHVTPTDHVYIGGPNPNAADNSYAVLMPADGTVTTVAAMPGEYIGDRQGQQVAAEDHRIVVSHSCRYFSIFIHIHKLGDKLAAAVGKLQPNENKQSSVELKAGEVIGYIGNSTFDWTPIDTTVTLKGFITPSNYEGEPWKIHTVSPFDLYSGELKTQLEAKSLRTTPPLGGKIDYDQPGKLIGNWFGEGTGGYTGPSGNNGGRYWDGHLSVAPDYIDPTYTVVSIGNWQGNAAQFAAKNAPDPASVSTGSGMVKMELIKLTYVSGSSHWSGNMLAKGLHPDTSGAVVGTIAFEVLPGEKLKVEKFPGKTAAQVTGFTAAAQMYER